ncbi:MAG: hypothetical protein UY41_C0028G0005 [Candidatus Moranbacteria bacterium GW2011_GWE1_49_15]|nr:MAG: hypothetical protein UX75_C0028G0014 [Candidatus Moranbacteria bacterium GW2011_GWE2_47_10]KKW06354.1 MAG: hypothetical protein UY41_C0028G0005 [Candidatus Moranbacteria bacterium GW2011_GWE1_49_15]
MTGWYAFWEFKNNGIRSVAPALDFLPFGAGNGEDYKNAAKIADYFLEKDGGEKTFLVLFQNNLEIRPGGGFIGAFGIIKTEDGKVSSIETHDLSNFDGRIPEGIEPPYPMKETLKIKSWKLRDSNYSPDFETNAKKAEEFYYLGQGQENFDGIVGITTNVLSSILAVTGPVELADYPGTYDSQNAVITLEYQVEKAFEEQGIDRGERKSVMRELAEEIEMKADALPIAKKLDLAKTILNDLNKKEIQLYFKDAEMQNVAMDAGWSGEVDRSWDGDYLMMVDANLGAFKSDYYVNRSADYTVDLSKDVPTAHLKITYRHTAKQRDWMTRDYLSYLRVYVPEGAWLSEWKNFENPKFGSELGRKYFGGIVKVPIGQERAVELSYVLPENIGDVFYDLKTQKQSGILDVPVSVHVIAKDGSKKDYDFRMNSDIVLSELGK